MKKTILVILAMIMLFTFSVYADDEFTLAFTVNETQGGLNYYLKVKGNIEASYDIVSIKVEDASGNPAYFGQSVSDENGNYTFLIKLTNGGDYNVYVNSFSAVNPSMPVHKAFFVPDENAYNEALEVLNADEKTTDDYETFFDGRASEFGLDTFFYTKVISGKTKVIEELFAKKGSYTIGNISDSFLEGVITGVVKSDESYLLKDELIRYYMGDVIVPDSRYTKLYNTYISSDDAFKEKIWSNMLSRNLNDYKNIQESLYCSTIKIALDSMNNQQFDSFVLTSLELPGYENLGPVKKVQILERIKVLAFDTVEKFEENYVNIKTAIENANQTQPSVPSGGGGGGGGGGGSSAAKEYEKLPEPVIEEKEEDKKQEFIEAGFTDLADVPWAKDAILEFKRKGIVNGKTETEFAPLDFVTRAEFCKILVNAFDISENGGNMKFSDVNENAWYYPYVLSAYQCGVLSGYEDGTFRPNDKVTREQMVTILYRYLQRKQMVEPLDKIENRFSDYNDISDYARTSVLVLNNAGYVNGVGSGMFMPRKEAGRAEVCVIIYNILNGGATK